MPIDIGQIVKNLIPSEPVTINQIQGLGRMVSVSYTGVNSNVSSNKVIPRDEFERLEVLTSQGIFNFTGDPTKFSLFAEAERINSAYQFDPLFAVNCSIVDPLPHQVEAVYKFLLPLPKIRFLLADIPRSDILHIYDHDFAGAEREHLRAIELNPNYSTAYHFYGIMVSYLGRHEESLAQLERALEIDPFSLNLIRGYGERLIFARRYDDAITQLKKTLELDADLVQAHFSLAVAYQMKGNYAEAVEEYAKYQEQIGEPQTAAIMRESYSKSGWQGFLRMITEKRIRFNSPLDNLATFYAALGEKDKAFAELNKSYENRENIMSQLKVDPRLDPLRSDPRFADLVRRVGLPQ